MQTGTYPLHLLFLGVRSGTALARSLQRAGFFLYHDRLPQNGAPLDLIVWRAPREMAITEVVETLERQRAAHPAAWIALIASRRRLQEPDYCRHILECNAKDDVWTVGSWEALFWLALQRAQRVSRLRAELTSLTALKPLREKSSKLVRQLEDDVELASHIQRSFLPQSFPEIPGVTFTAKYLPSPGLGGDYFDMFEFGDRRRFGILVADSKTHGMAAALLSALLKVRLDEMKDRFPDSASFLEHLHAEMQGIDPAERASLSVLYGILDRRALTFRFTAAGHLHPLLWRDGALVVVPRATSAALGESGPAAFRQIEVALRPGDLLLLHTDGLTRLLPPDRMERILAASASDPVVLQQDVLGIVDRHRSHEELPDDITLLQLAVGARALYLSHRK